MKIHLERTPGGRRSRAACGQVQAFPWWRSVEVTDNPREVTCSRCKGTMKYLQAITEPPTTTEEQ